jgi:hypothetical protein
MECSKSELDLFSDRAIQTCIKSNRVVGYKPINTLDNETQIEFNCPGDSEYYRDLASVSLWLKIRMVKYDGTEFKDDDENQPGCINYLLNTLFSQVAISLNDTNVTTSTDNHQYRSIIETLFNYSTDAAKTHLVNSMFYLDSENDDGSLKASDDNKGFVKRASMLKNSKSVELYGRLHADLFNTSQLLLKNVSMRVKLSRSRPEFYLLSTSSNVVGKIQILDATLYMKHVELSSTQSLAIERHLSKEPAKYHLNRVELKNVTIPKGSTSINLNNIIQGTMPKYVIFGMVNNNSYVGSVTTNPFEFIHKDLEYIALYINGAMVNEPLRPNFDRIENVTMAYQSLFSGIGIYHQNHSILITKDMYFHGYSYFSFDLTADSAGTDSHSSLPESGTLRVELRFGKELKDSLSCIIYAVYDSTIIINNRTISLI